MSQFNLFKIKYIPQKSTIYNEESKSDKIQTGLVNELFVPKIVETKIEDQEVVKKNTLKTPAETNPLKTIVPTTLTLTVPKTSCTVITSWYK